MNIYEQSVNKLMDRWYTRESANRIITKRFQSSWIFHKWTQKLTDYWIKQQSVTEQEREILRYAKQNKVNPRKIRIKNGKPVLYSIYKK